MTKRSLQTKLSYALFLFVCFSLPLTAQAALPGLTTVQPCLNALQPPSQPARRCAHDQDCQSGELCYRTVCLVERSVPADHWDETERFLQTQRASSASRSSSGEGYAGDDGGAYAACGADRRCRIDRMATRNRHRRQLQIAHEERAVQQEVNRILEQRRANVIRLDKPWAVALQIHPTGYGLLGSHAVNAHFRAEATLVYRDSYVYFIPDDPQLPSVDGRHSSLFGFAHLTYLPSTAWFSPFLSVGFGMGRGEYGSYSWDRPMSGQGSQGSGNSPGVRYHVVTAALGAEAQFESGSFFRLGFRHGRLLYNQARYGPGSYDDGARRSLREYMHSEGLMGLDLSIGWTF